MKVHRAKSSPRLRKIIRIAVLCSALRRLQCCHDSLRRQLRSRRNARFARDNFCEGRNQFERAHYERP